MRKQNTFLGGCQSLCLLNCLRSKNTLKQGKFLNFWNWQLNLKRSWKVIDFEELKRLQTLPVHLTWMTSYKRPFRGDWNKAPGDSWQTGKFSFSKCLSTAVPRAFFPSNRNKNYYFHHVVWSALIVIQHTIPQHNFIQWYYIPSASLLTKQEVKMADIGQVLLSFFLWTKIKLWPIGRGQNDGPSTQTSWQKKRLCQ